MVIIKLFYSTENPYLGSVNCRTDLKNKLIQTLKTKSVISDDSFLQTFLVGTKECMRSDLNLEVFTSTKKQISSQTYETVLEDLESNIITFFKKLSGDVNINLSIVLVTNNQNYSRFYSCGC